MKQHRTAAFAPQDQAHFKFNYYFEVLGPDAEFKDIFDPAFWIHAKRKLKQNDIIRLLAHDRSFDIHVTVTSVPAGGVMMRYLYGDPGPGVDNPYAYVRDLRTEKGEPRAVPITRAGKSMVRVEFIPATKWRVLGLNGDTVKRDLASKEEAEVAMDAYLREINMRLPTEAELAAAVAASGSA